MNTPAAVAICVFLLAMTSGPAAAQDCAAVTVTPGGAAQCWSPSGDLTGQPDPSRRSDGDYTDAPRYIPPLQCPAGAMCN